MQCTRPGFNPWVRKISWRRKGQPNPVFFPGEFRGQRSLGSYSPWGHKELDRTEEILIAKFRLKLKKVGKTTRSFRYDLNQIPYDYTVEVTNRFRGLCLIGRVPDELWTEVRDIVQEAGIKIIPKKKKCKKAKQLSEEDLQITVKTREVKRKGENER